MARRSNKTAHVLNLIAGHEAQKEEAEEAVSSGAADATASAGTGQAAPASAPSAQNIAVIDTTEKDPVADLIQQKLSDVLDQESAGSAAQSAADIPVQAETAARTEAHAQTVSDTPAQADTITPAEAHAPTAPGAPVQMETAAETETAAQAEAHTQPEADSPVQAEDSIKAPAASPEPEPEPEPSFAAVNVMERIVRDKIIYYMRQFEVCTCDRCIADTIALTLNGLMPKYIVTTPAAVDPLLSYYTNRLISDVTVEATKACMVVKENPRH